MQQEPVTKYKPFPPIDLPDRQWPARTLTQAPIWCSVDLRDGNQALAVPMNVEEKLEIFQLLVKLGFKEIEIGFPSASDTEFAFCRRLIEENLIPEGVAVQVLVQAREHLIRRTFEAINGAPEAIVHLYNSTNPLQRRVTFNLTKEQIRDIAIEGTKLVKSLIPTVPETRVRFQYSPESFSDTELSYSLEVCEAVLDTWDPAPGEKVILNLPATVELATPNVHADQIEWFSRNVKRREQVIISLHTHNDRGTGIAATELGMLAGADRVEGTLFGNGERTGNVDLVAVALNLYTQGVHPGLDFSDLPQVRAVYERTTRMEVHDRWPYAGDLVFTAFSGSHQDAIKKGMDQMNPTEGAHWQVPYLPIDPEDIGRTYHAIIRINSQSGKGGVAYVMEVQFGLEMPKRMHPEFGMIVNQAADNLGNELSADEIHALFTKTYLNLRRPLDLDAYTMVTDPDDHRNITIEATIEVDGVPQDVRGTGNGPISSLTDALANAGLKDFRLTDFRQHAITGGSRAEAASYVEIERTSDNKRFWGVGIDGNIELASLKAIVSAFNRSR